MSVKCWRLHFLNLDIMRVGGQPSPSLPNLPTDSAVSVFIIAELARGTAIRTHTHVTWKTWKGVTG